MMPMLEIGEKLTGKFTALEFIPLNTGGYYYNPDKRCGGLFGEAGEEACQLINTLTVDAINKLFTEYNQTTVIVAEGFTHR